MARTQVDDFKSIRNKAVLASRAGPLFRRYFAADSKSLVVIDPEVVAKIESELEAPKASTFTVAQVSPGLGGRRFPPLPRSPHPLY